MAYNLPHRLHYNYVLSEMDYVLFEDLSAYPIVTEDFLYRTYQDCFDKNLKVELEQLSVNLREVIEQEFGAQLKWLADSEFNAIARRSSINSQILVDPLANDADANTVSPQAAANAYPSVAASGYATPAWKDSMKLQELLSYLQESEALVADDQLLKTRTAKTAKYNRDRHPMAMNFVDFYALIKYGGHLSLDDYDGLRDWVDFDDFSGQKFGRELKGEDNVRMRVVGERQMDALYGFHHPVICWNDTKHTNPHREGDSTFPRLPQIAVFERRQRKAGDTKSSPLSYVPMERLEILDDKDLIFACIRLARLEKLSPPKQGMRTDCLIEI